MVNWVTRAVTGLVKPITNVFVKREERKKVVQSIQAKTAQGKQEGDTQIQLNESEWELIGQRLQGQTWKDEFVTVIVFSPFITLIVGAIFAAFGKPELSNAAATMLGEMNELGMDYSTLLWVTASAALGLKAIKQ